MTDLPSEDVTICDGEITIDAALLAPKLGLSPETLKAEMAKDMVYSIAETGVDEEEGRTRLTFHYRARAWVVVVEPHGRLVEPPPPTHRPAPLSLINLVQDMT